MPTTNQEILVKPSFIMQHRKESTLVVLDATMPVPGADQSALIAKKIIPGALKFDLDQIFSDNSKFPHTMLSPKAFTEKVQELGINQNSRVVVYDDIGIFSSPRVWWMFRAMGFENIFILNGGLKSWLASGLSVDAQYGKKSTQGDFQARPQAGYFITIDEVKKAISNKQLIIDARNADRFNAKVDEPRPNLRRGNIPSSKNLPFQSLLNEQGYLRKEQLERCFDNFDLDQPIIFSCGSGVTACIDAVAAKICGFTSVSVYDGSWCEWGTVVEP